MGEESIREVTLGEVLDAREARVRMQEALRERFHCPVVSFTMNIAGPVKRTPLIERSFHRGVGRLLESLKEEKIPVLFSGENIAVTGCEALFALDAKPQRIKELCVAIEEETPLGRLYDIDVLDLSGEKLARGQERCCLVCSKQGRECASRRLHSVAELQQVTEKIQRTFWEREDRQRVGELVTRALLREVHTTPKPGLVDENNNGSHRDMDLSSFEKSAQALNSYWEEGFALGIENREEEAAEAFALLRRAGQEAEGRMYEATGGVNTHKGAIFSLGIHSMAAGRLYDAACPVREAKLLTKEGAALCKRAVEEDFAKTRKRGPQTYGERLYLEEGRGGIRQEAYEGFPLLTEVALPRLKEGIEAGLSENDAGVRTLLYLIAQGKDTNLCARGGVVRAGEVSRQVREMLEAEPYPPRGKVEELDAAFIQENLSPGGCADLLAAAWFLYDWEKEKV